MEAKNFVFLVQSESGTSVKGEKSIINAHISRKAHDRKKRLRDETPTSCSNASTLRRLTTDFAKIPSSTCPLCANTSSECSQCSSSLALARQISPAIVKQHGNSDPFGVLPIRIDATRNRYLVFGRDVLEPAVHQTGYRGFKSPSPNSAEYPGIRDLIGNLSLIHSYSHISSPGWQECFIYAVLAYCASGISIISGDDLAAKDALIYITKGMSALRSCLSVLGQERDFLTEELMYRLLRAEVLSQNISSASAHANILRKMFEQKVQNRLYHRGLLTAALYQDNHLSTAFWKRPSFDPGWIERNFRHSWTNATAIFPITTEENGSSLSSCIDDSCLRSIFIDIRRLLCQTRANMNSNQQATAGNYCWFASQYEWIQMRLLDHYHNSNRNNGGLLAHAIDERSRWHQCACLAALAAVRHVRNDPIIERRHLYTSLRNIHERLTTVLSDLMLTFGQRSGTGILHFFLWSTYFAALCEDRLNCQSSADGQLLTWHRRFGRVARTLGVVEWGEIREILGSFIFCDLDTPPPSDHWVSNALMACPE